MDRELASIDRADAARRVLLDALIADGIIPGPTPPTLFRSVGVMAEKPDCRDHFVQVILPIAIDVSNIPSEIDGVRVVVIHEDRRWVASSM